MSASHTPPRKTARSNQRPTTARRIVRYEEPRAGFFRRTLRAIFQPPIVIALVFLLTLSIGVLGYYYFVFSERIDLMLRGEIFTRSAGIYAQPKAIRPGEAMTPDALVARLKRLAYVERAQQADASRGRYAVKGATVEIEPSENSRVDGRTLYSALAVSFNKNIIAGIKEIATGRNVDAAWLEPEQLSSVTGEDREKRKVVGFRDLPAHLVKAVTVTEDRAFFEHNGINIRGILRALVRRYDNENTAANIREQGGSSITQQLVKNLLLSPEKTITRKVAEAYMSVILETRLSKEEIFALYCNEVYLGQQSGFSISGMGEAANAYFNKDVTSLTLPESAFLAGIIRSPNRYNPYRNNETAFARRNQVLQSMKDAAAITDAEQTAAMSTPLKLAPARGRLDTTAPYFLDYVQQSLGDVLSDTSDAQHLRIYTTLDMDLQRAAYDAVTKNLQSLDKVFAKRKDGQRPQAALVAMNAETGEIIAMVGGRDYEKSAFNRATDALRQPGSVFKPFVYATALNTAYDRVPRLITPATVYKDEAKIFNFDNQEYKPNNFGDTFSNAPVTLRDALVRSLNVITVDVAMEVTIGRVMNLAAKAGLPRPSRAYPAMALGTSEATPLQIASAYTAFAAGGTRTAPLAINRITTGAGKTVIAPQPARNEVLRPEVAYVMTSMMRDVVDRGTGAKLRQRGFKYNVAGKTGTSRDAWFTGYTPKIVCAVYVGFDDGAELGMTGGDAALPIWEDFMSAALASHLEWTTDWQLPAGVEQAVIDTTNGGLATEESAVKRTELFIAGTAPLAPVEPLEGELTESELEVTDESGTGELVPAPPSISGENTDDVPEMNMPPPPRTRTPPRLEGRGVTQPDGSTRLVGTITLDVDPATGLLASRACPVTRRQVFQIGTEPKRSCGAAYHNGRTVMPSDSRGRLN